MVSLHRIIQNVYAAGLTPDSNESNGKKKSVQITHAEVLLKSTLVQCAHAIENFDKPSNYKRNVNHLLSVVTK